VSDYLAKLRRWLHLRAHWLGWNHGRAWSITDSEGAVWVGFRCDGCGSIDGVHKRALRP
jgi:hypothetical protein